MCSKNFSEFFLNNDKATYKNIRLRLLNKKMDTERIIKNDEMLIKKLTNENNIKILIEFLEKEENLTENEIQLYIFNRNSHKKIYENKKIIF